MPVVINSNTINVDYMHESPNDVTSLNDTIKIENIDLNLNKIMHNRVQPSVLNSNNVESPNIDVTSDNLVISPCDEAFYINMDSLSKEESCCFPPINAMDNLKSNENIEDIFVLEHDDENNVRENLVNIKKNNYMYFYNDCCVLM